jgi:hypothetical protein
MTHDDDCGAIGGMKIGRRILITRREPASLPLRPPQIPLDLTRARTRTAAVGSQRLFELWHGHIYFCNSHFYMFYTLRVFGAIAD